MAEKKTLVVIKYNFCDFLKIFPHLQSYYISIIRMFLYFFIFDMC